MEEDAYIPTCDGCLYSNLRWTSGKLFFVFKFSSACLRAAAGLQAASVILSGVCCLPPYKPPKRQLLPLLFQQRHLIPVSLGFFFK